MRAAMSPLVAENPVSVYRGNLIGNNSGNMLFAHGVCRVLMDEETTVDTFKTSHRFNKQDFDYINENYDYLVLPFANAFRSSFMKELDNCSKLVEHLKIPVAIVGVGLQDDVQTALQNRELSEKTKRLVKAVLKRSSIVGLRGELTAEFLNGLGFQAEKDYTVIGCPSLYAFGEHLPAMECKELTGKSKVSLNAKAQLPDEYHHFMHNNAKRFEDAVYVPQVRQEIYRMYAGIPYPKNWCPNPSEYFPARAFHDVFVTGKAKSFINVKEWLSYMADRDFSFGSRIHGNIAAIMAGTPAYVLVSDARIKELVDYHHIPYCMMDDINADTSIFDLYEKADFSAIHKHHKQNVEHYKEFLEKNGLPHILDLPAETESPFDRLWKKVDFYPTMEPFTSLPVKEQVERVEQYMDMALHGKLRKDRTRYIIQSDGKRTKLPSEEERLAGNEQSKSSIGESMSSIFPWRKNK